MRRAIGSFGRLHRGLGREEGTRGRFCTPIKVKRRGRCFEDLVRSVTLREVVDAADDIAYFEK